MKCGFQKKNLDICTRWEERGGYARRVWRERFDKPRAEAPGKVAAAFIAVNLSPPRVANLSGTLQI
jgi:hypothetical protein